MLQFKERLCAQVDLEKEIQMADLKDLGAFAIALEYNHSDFSMVLDMYYRRNATILALLMRNLKV